jgi:hypothetical protein
MVLHDQLVRSGAVALSASANIIFVFPKHLPSSIRALGHDCISTIHICVRSFDEEIVMT